MSEQRIYHADIYPLLLALMERDKDKLVALWGEVTYMQAVGALKERLNGR